MSLSIGGSSLGNSHDSAPKQRKSSTDTINKLASRIDSKMHANIQMRSDPVLLSSSAPINSTVGDSLPLKLEPSELRFDSIQPGILYVMTFSVRNTTKSAQRIRIEPPKTSFFALNYIPTGPVAPGLDIRAEIECQLPEKSLGNYFKDSIVAVMGPHKVELPIYANKPAPIISFESLLNLGLVIEGNPLTQMISFENIGIVAGKVSIKTGDKSCLKFDPSIFELGPKVNTHSNHISVEVRFESKDLGVYREFVQLIVEGNPEPMILDVSATVTQQKLILLSEKKRTALEFVDFGSIFYGKETEIRGILVNNGPQTVNYNLNYADDEEVRDYLPASSGLQELALIVDRPMSITPSEGTLKPFAQTVISFRFRPKFPDPQHGFHKKFERDFELPKQFSGRVSVEIADANLGGSWIALRGIAVMPKVLISPAILRFGVCPVYDRRDMLISLTSKSVLPLHFSFSKIALFRVNPLEGTLQPKETLSVVVSFLPSQLGKVRNILKCLLEQGLVVNDVRVVGEAVPSENKKQPLGGTNMLPEDFNPVLKFVDPAKGDDESISMTVSSQNTFSRILPALDPDFESSTTWDEAHRPHGEKTVHNDTYTYSIQQLQRRAEHDQQYVEYLEQSRKLRQDKKRQLQMERTLARGGADKSDPFGVDMGMEKGLNPPELKVPLASEPLWLERRMGEEAGGRGRRIPVDENRLIIKKHPETPSTQAELRDCSKVLTLEECRLVSPSHKILNFGRVCVTSVTAKNFVITNDLKHSVEVRLHGLDNELKQSKPEVQIIPEGGVAGFDIYFTCREVCKFKKFITWTVNGQNPTKLMVIAEVVNIELVMDRNVVEIVFPVTSLEKSCTDKIVLSNPGNAPAEYLWTSQGAFQCVPVQGVIEPGRSIPVSVIWTPNPLYTNEDHVGLHVVGGQDLFLSAIGHLKECKTNFEEKKLVLGTLAVGQSRKLVVHIRNTGVNPAVFHFDEPNDMTGVEISPMSGCVGVGDLFEVEVYVKPKLAMSYDTAAIVASVRGGKSMILKFSGESKIPDISLLEKSFNLGSVVVGSEYRVPFTLQNNANFNASLMLNLEDHQDLRPCFVGTPVTKQVSKVSDDVGNSLEPVIHSTNSLHSRYSITDDTPSGLWRITLNPNSTFYGELVFTPTVPRSHHFKLPLYVHGLDQRPYSRDVSAEGLTSKLQVTTFNVDFGDRVVSRDPGSRMTYFKEITFTNVDSTLSRLNFEIRERGTPSEEGLEPVYFVSPVKGDLLPTESIVVRVTFLPQGHGDFSKDLDVYVTGQPDASRPYFTISCAGSGVFPRLSFNKYRVVLPTVPLGITTRNSFEIINNGYDNLELKYRISPTIPIPLNIAFPVGSDVGLTRDKAVVIVSAKSDVSVSFTGKIEFYDTDGERFSIEICGCVDGSLMTVYPFVKQYKDRYGFFSLPEQPVTFLSKREISALKQQEAKRKENQRRQRAQERQKQSGKTPTVAPVAVPALESKASKETLDEFDGANLAHYDGIDLDREIPKGANDDECRFLMLWLNKFICKKPFDVPKFPDAIVEGSGDVVIDCIETLSGRKVLESRLGFEGRGESRRSGTGNPEQHHDSRGQAVEKLLKKYRSMIAFLIKYGALLTHINPMALLGLDDYVFAVEQEYRKQESSRVTTAMINDRRFLASQEWLDACKQAWSEVLFQAVKIFLLSRVTYKEFKDSPGVFIQESREGSPDGRHSSTNRLNSTTSTKAKKGSSTLPPELRGSNVYNPSEAILLEWVNYHLRRAVTLEDVGYAAESTSNAQQMHGFDKRVSDLEDDARDNFLFCQIFHSHLPETTKHGHALSAYTNPVNKSQDALFKRFQIALIQYRLDFDFSMTELQSSSRSLMLMLLHLFLNLPLLIPRTTIEFKGTLGAPILKTIELRNPSTKRVSYRITREGSEDFHLSFESLVIEPESAVDFAITCTPRFSTAAAGRVTFWGVRDKGSGPSTMVFKLISNIVDRKPIEVKKLSVPLFELESFQLTVTNPFDVACAYPITIHDTFVRSSALDALQNRAQKSAAGKRKVVLEGLEHTLQASLTMGDPSRSEEQREDEEEIRKLLEHPVWCSEQSLHLLPKESGTITVYALPFIMGKYTSQIVFMDPIAGEFCYQVELDVGIPLVSEKIEFTVPQVGGGTSVQRALRIVPRNSAFETAAGMVSEMRLHVSKRIRARSVLQQFLSYTVASEDDPTTHFRVDIQSPYFNGQKEFPCVSDYATMVGRPMTGTLRPDFKKSVKFTRNVVEELTPTEMSQPQLNFNSMIFSFFPEKPGMYKSRVAIYCKNNDLDFRVFELVANVTAPMRNTTLEFKGAAKQTLTQEIPIVNDSTYDWVLQANIQGREFSGSKGLTLKKGDKAVYTVSFLAQFSGTFEGTLTLREATQNEIYQYKLVGIAEEPLAEGHLSFKCAARAKKTFTIPVKRIDIPNRMANKANQVLKVDTDLLHVTGESTVDVGPSGGEYSFSVQSPVGGVITGSIIFTEPTSGSLVWYTVEIEVTSPEAESVIVVEAMVRKAVAIEITLDNPSSQSLDVEVVLQGEGLIGDPIFTLPAGASNLPYELIYSPLLAGKHRGKITFRNDLIGEFWYSLQLTAIPAPPTQLETIECMLGSTNKLTVPIENPLDIAVQLAARISNPEHFSVLPEGNLYLEPYSQSSFEVVFSPSSLTEIATSSITFSHPSFGEVVFEASGKGLLPGVMPGMQVYAPLSEMASHTVLFKNPFLHPLPVDVYLDESMDGRISAQLQGLRSPGGSGRSETSGKKIFGLLLRKSSGVVVPPRGSFQVGISFTPEKLGQYSSSLLVRSTVGGRALMWCFPISGVAEAGAPLILPKLVTKCKTSIMKDVVIPLQGLKAADLVPGEVLDLSDFSLELEMDHDNKNALARAFRIQPLGLVEVENDSSTDFAISYRLLMEPLKVFRSSIQIKIQSHGRGRWRAEIDVEATDPDPDDLIQLSSAVGGQDRVSFRLSNRFLGYSSFQAYFSAHSSTHFSVQPTSGVLAPYGSDGTQFIVTFAPLEYGGREKAMLNIVTDDAQWTYEVNGSYPELVTRGPQIKSKVNSRR